MHLKKILWHKHLNKIHILFFIHSIVHIHYKMKTKHPKVKKTYTNLADRITHIHWFLYSFKIFLHSCPSLLQFSLFLKNFTNSNMLGLLTRVGGNNPLRSLSNLTHYIRQWYSSSKTSHISHFLSSNLNFLVPNLPRSTKNKCELRRTLDICILLDLFIKLR